MPNGLIEEYKSLREELLLHIKLERQILALSGTVFFIVFGVLNQVGTKLDHDLWGIILMALITPLFLLYRGEVFSIAKIASYIEKFIEPKVKGLEWTGTHIKARPRYGKQIFTWTSFRGNPHQTTSIYFMVLLAISWAVPWYLKGAN